MKLGKHGALYLTATGEHEHVDAVAVGANAALDATGAGDAFAAGFLHAWFSRSPLRATFTSTRGGRRGC